MKTRKINFIEAAMKFPQITLAITALLVGVGIIALLYMPRSENPHITVRQGVVYALFPGADESRTEKQLTDKIEQYLFSFEEVKKAKTHSETKNGQVSIIVELNDEVKDPKIFWNTLQRGLDVTLRPELPSGVIGPFVNSDFGDVVAEMITITSPQRSYAEMEKYLDKLEDGIKTIPEVSKINRYGGQRQQLTISVDDKKLRQYGLSFPDLANILRAQNETNYTGDVTISSNIVPIVAQGHHHEEASIANQVIFTAPDGRNVRLKNVATVERKYEDSKSYIEVGGNRVMMLTVQMQPGKNIVFLGDAVDKKLKEIKASLPPDIQLSTIVDQPKVVSHSIRNFMFEFAISIISVIIVVMLLLPLRIASISAVAAPISIAITFGIINLLGVEIQNVSLVAMIIVLGMLVDDAIVVVDNYTEKLDEGLSNWNAAWQSATQLMVPIFTATASIVFAYMPLAFVMKGLTGEFIQALPITITVALTASLLVALLLTPYMCYHFLKRGLKPKVSDHPVKKSILDRLQDGFNTALEFCFRWPKATMSVGALSLVLAILVAGGLKQELFPFEDRDQFNIEIWMPNGAGISKTAEAVKKVETAIKGEKRITYTANFVGASSPRFHFSYAPETPRQNYAQIFVHTISDKATADLAEEYRSRFKDFLPDGIVRIRRLSNKNTPAPVEVRVRGGEINDQKRIAAQIAEILRRQPGTYWIRNDYQDDFFGVSAVMNTDLANRLGVSHASITQTLGAEIKGYPITTLWEGSKPVDMVLRLDSNNRKDFSDLGNIYVNSQFSTKVPLKEMVDFLPAWHTGVIAHRNGLRTLTVLAEVDATASGVGVVADIEPLIEKINLPSGMSIDYGGEFEDANESSPNMGKSLLVSLVLIFITLLFQFKTVGKVLIVLAAFPLSLLGAMLGLMLTGNPLGFTAFMGIISLMGIVVRNGIILVDYADELILDHGYEVKAAAIAASKRRMRPIFLTSAAASAGLIPMIISKSPLWAPLGSVLASGLILSMVMTLFIVPILYYRFIKPSPGSLELGATEEITGDMQYKPSNH